MFVRRLNTSENVLNVVRNNQSCELYQQTFRQRTLTFVEVSLHSWSPVYFVWILLLSLWWMNNSFHCLAKIKPVKQEVSCTVILPLWWLFSALRIGITEAGHHQLGDGGQHVINGRRERNKTKKKLEMS